MSIALHDVLKEDGRILQLQVPLSLTEFASRLGRYPITEKDFVTLTLENKGKRKLLISGITDLVIQIPCGRCLTEVPVPFHLDFEKEIDMGLTEEERWKALDQDAFIHGYELDVDEMVYSEILVNWPMHVVCREDCKGICSTCGKNLNHGDCGCESADLDPRMAQIRDIFNKYKEV